MKNNLAECLLWLISHILHSFLRKFVFYYNIFITTEVVEESYLSFSICAAHTFTYIEVYLLIFDKFLHTLLILYLKSDSNSSSYLLNLFFIS